MIPSFNICQTDNCSITITGLSYDEGLYLNDSSVVQPYDKFKYNDTATVNILELTKVDGIEFIEGLIVDHCSYLDESHISFKQDGYYTISHIILPIKECIDRIIAEDPTFVDYYTSGVYAVDGNKIVKLVNRNWKVVPIQELTINNCNTTIFKSEQETFAICNIWKCYVDICKSLLKSDLTECRKDNIDSSSLLFNRDVIWMTINVLTYYINRNQLFEAQRILEEVNGCNGFCNKSYSMLKSGGCGCGR